MRVILPITAAGCLCLAALSTGAGTAWSGQTADGQGNLRQAQEFYRAGQEHMQSGNFTAANEAFEKAELVLHADAALPELPEAPAAPAPALTKELLHAAPPAVLSGTLDPDIYYNLGVGALQKGDFIQAEAAFLRVVDLSPADKDACYNLGVLYEKYLDRPNEAIKYYKRYISLSDERDRDVEWVKGWIKDIKERVRE